MALSEHDRVLTHQEITVLDRSISHLETLESKLAADLDNLRLNISDLHKQRLELKSRVAAVWFLPNELLSYIFELGVVDQEARIDEPIEDEGNDDSAAMNIYYRKNIEFQLLISQVCRMFRQVAIHTPSLWSRISIIDLDPQRLDFVRACIERSGTSPLDISLWIQEARFTGDDEELISFAELLAPHIPRFKCLRGRLRGFSGLHFIMQTMNRPAPLLETLELRDVDYDSEFDENEDFDPPDLRQPLILFDGHVPKLRRLILDGVHVKWSACNFRDLVELYLRYHTYDVRPSYDEFKAIVQASPALQTLQLSGSSPLIPEDDVEPPLYMPVPMEQLSTLTISDIPSDYVTNLVSLLLAPNLKSLTLADMDNNDYSRLVRKIAGPPTMFPALTSLKLAAIEVHDSACEDLLGAYPTLTYLSLDFRRMPRIWLDVLGPKGAERDILCPKLERLRCVGTSTSDIKLVLESRLEAGFKISHLELDEDSVEWATTSSMKWIRDNVTLETIVPSEDGSDDENGTDSGWATDDDDIEIGFPMFSMNELSDMEVDGDEDDEDYDDESDDGSHGILGPYEAESSDSTDGTEDSDEE